MKTIMFPAHEDSGQEARLQVALDVCRALKGHLACLDVLAPPGVYAEIYGIGVAEFLFVETRSEAENRAEIEARLAREDVSWDWTHVVGDPARRIVEAVAFADLIVASSRYERVGHPDGPAVIGDLILHGGRPMLAVPPETRALAVTGNALVAWNGSRAAIDALRAAVPLLRFAADVQIVEVGETARDHPAGEAAAYLSRHGIAATVATARLEGSVAQALIDHARAMSAAYIVMGGYGHSRVGEALFGGVTREMLERCPIPLLIAH